MKIQAAQNLAERRALHALEMSELRLDAINEFIIQHGKESMIRQRRFIGFTWSNFTDFVKNKQEDPAFCSFNVNDFLDEFLDQDEVTHRTGQHLDSMEANYV